MMVLCIIVILIMMSLNNIHILDTIQIIILIQFYNNLERVKETIYKV